MLRWVGGCALVLVIVVGGVFWLGYRQITSIAEEGPSSTLVIKAPAERVFASLVDPDSMTHWRLEGAGIQAFRKGPVQAGDTLVMQVQGSRPQRMTWIVSAVVPNQVVAAQLRSDSGQVIMERRDSVEALGDSTRVHVSVATPALDPTRAGPDSAKVPAFASKLLIGGMRMQATRELASLKWRIEGTSGDTTAARRDTPRN